MGYGYALRVIDMCDLNFRILNNICKNSCINITVVIANHSDFTDH